VVEPFFETNHSSLTDHAFKSFQIILQVHEP
jgi:succinate dehydrogenase flavin-adding protein (antitoxin of CptAB toxin-antitoxin module)